MLPRSITTQKIGNKTMIDFADLIERLRVWSDSYHRCTQCNLFESACDCIDAHAPDESGQGKNWKPTDESAIFDEAIAAIEMLFNFTDRACPKCDGCGKLLLLNATVESDGLHGKPARIVCDNCKDPNFVKEPSRAALSMQNWHLSEGDADVVMQALATKSAIAKIACEPLKPYVS